MPVPMRAVALAFLLALSGSALADQFVLQRGGWQTYVNDRFGVRIDFPADIFTAEAEPENGDGRVFDGRDATLQVHAFLNHENETPASLKRRTIGSEGYKNVTYSPHGGSWLVLSGFRDGNIFYEKFSFRRGVISAFGVEFPPERKPFYAPIIERMEDSFRAGG